MASADFSRFVVTTGFISVPPARETSPGKGCDFHLIYLPHLRPGVRAVLDFALLGKLVRPNTPNVISVRQAEVLPPASFSFHLTMDTLAFG